MVFNLNFYWCNLLIHAVSVLIVRSFWYHLCEKTLKKFKRKKKKKNWRTPFTSWTFTGKTSYTIPCWSSLNAIAYAFMASICFRMTSLTTVVLIWLHNAAYAIYAMPLHRRDLIHDTVLILTYYNDGVRLLRQGSASEKTHTLLCWFSHSTMLAYAFTPRICFGKSSYTILCWFS